MKKRNSPETEFGSRTLIYSMLVSAYFFSYFFRVSSSVSLPIIAGEWGMSASLVGLISSLYFYAYAFMQPVSGALNDRFGPMKVVSLGMATSGVGALVFAFAPTPFVLGIGRLLTGLGLAPMLSGVLVFQSHSFPVDRYSFYSGITYTVGNLGAVVSVAPLAFALDEFGRKNVFVLLSLMNFLLAVMLISKRREDPVANMDTMGNRSSFVENLKSSFRKIGHSTQLKLMLVLWGVSFGALMSLQGLWAVSWYQVSYGISHGSASAWSTLISVGVMLGNFAGAYIARPSRYRRIAIVSSCLSYGLAWCIFWISMRSRLPIALPGVMGFILGVSAGISYDHLTAGVNDLSAREYGGSLFGGMNLFTFISVIAFQWGTGAFLQFFSTGSVGIYDPGAYSKTFGIVTFMVIMSLLALPFLKSFQNGKGSKLI